MDWNFPHSVIGKRKWNRKLQLGRNWQHEKGYSKMAGDVEDFDNYHIIFIGFPIWWGATPPVVNTFMNAHGFSGKTVIPFCTSGGSGIGGSLADINRYCTGASVLSGRDLTSANVDTVRGWLTSIGMLP